MKVRWGHVQVDSAREAVAAAVAVPAELLHSAEHLAQNGGQRAEHGVCHPALLPAVPVRANPPRGAGNASLQSTCLAQNAHLMHLQLHDKQKSCYMSNFAVPGSKP